MREWSISMHPSWRACVAITWISYRCVPCHPWCTHRTSLVGKKKTFQFSCGCEKFHEGRSFGFLVINVCNHGEHYEMLCIFDQIKTRFYQNCFKRIIMIQHFGVHTRVMISVICVTLCFTCVVTYATAITNLSYLVKNVSNFVFGW